MSVLSWLLKRVGLVPEPEWDDRTHIQHAAVAHAQSYVEDREASEALRADLADIRPEAISAEIDGWWDRSDYVSDRAYRLLVSVLDGRMPEIEPDRREILSREADLLGRPVPEAFELISQANPGLWMLADEVRGQTLSFLKIARRVHKTHPTLATTDELIAARHLFNVSAGLQDNRPLFHQLKISSSHSSGQGAS